jgi:hypothetical protein
MLSSEISTINYLLTLDSFDSSPQPIYRLRTILRILGSVFVLISGEFGLCSGLSAEVRHQRHSANSLCLHLKAVLVKVKLPLCPSTTTRTRAE